MRPIVSNSIGKTQGSAGEGSGEWQSDAAPRQQESSRAVKKSDPKSARTSGTGDSDEIGGRCRRGAVAPPDVRPPKTSVPAATVSPRSCDRPLHVLALVLHDELFETPALLDERLPVARARGARGRMRWWREPQEAVLSFMELNRGER